MKTLTEKMLKETNNRLKSGYGLSIDDFYSITVRLGILMEVTVQGRLAIYPEAEKSFVITGVPALEKTIEYSVWYKRKEIKFNIEIVLT